MVSTRAGPVPLYGTCVIFTPESALNSSNAMCVELPTPAEALFNAPGFALAMASRSFTDFAGSDGCTARMKGAWEASEIGTKSFAGS